MVQRAVIRDTVSVLGLLAFVVQPLLSKAGEGSKVCSHLSDLVFTLTQ